MSLIQFELFLVIIILPITNGILQQATLIIITSLNILQIIRTGKVRLTKPALTLGSIWFVWMCIIWVKYSGGISRIFQMTAFFSMLYLATNHLWSSEELRFARNLYLLLFASWAVFFPLVPSLTMYSAYFANSNALGTLCFNAVTFLLLVPFKRKTTTWVMLFIALVFTIISGSRTSLIAIITLLLFSHFFSNSERKGITKKNAFFVILAIIIAVTVAYPTLLNTEVGALLDGFSVRYFNKTIFSGRHYIWQRIIELIRKRPIDGYGAGVDLSQITFNRRSGHNLYLQTALQSGLIGLSLMLLFIYLIYVDLSSTEGKRATIATAFLLSVLVHELFEVSLTQNNWHLGFVYWLIFGIGLSNRKKNDLTVNKRVYFNGLLNNKPL